MAPGRWLSPHGGRSYRPGQMDRRRLRCENPHPHRGLGAPSNGGSLPAGCNASRRSAAASGAAGLLVWFGILTKWLSFTRLETRTKESYIYASDRVGNSFAE
jgi:hypothetical protein